MTEADAVATTCDELLGGRVCLEQPARGYRVAIDSVLLAAAVPAKPGDRVLDAGAGAGAASLCLRARVPGLHIVALERDPLFAVLARRNVARNRAAQEIELVEGDLLQPPALLRQESFDIVMTNPPFEPAGQGTPPGEHGRAVATIESAGLAHWIGACLRRLRPRGWLALVHRAGRVDVALAALSGRSGDIRLFPLWPDAGAAEARRVLLLARKAVRGEAHLLRGLVLHREDGGFTAEAEAILRGAAPIAALAGLARAGHRPETAA